MKTIHEYEAIDIDANNDPIHGFLLGEILVILLTVRPSKEEEGIETLNKAVADFLNKAQKAGITLVYEKP